MYKQCVPDSLLSSPAPEPGNETLVILTHRTPAPWEASLVPRLPGMQNVHTWRAWYLFSHDHDIIEIGPEFLEQKGNVLHVIPPTLHSTLCVYDTRPPIAKYV